MNLSKHINNFLHPPLTRWERALIDGWNAAKGGEVAKGVLYITQGAPGLLLFLIGSLSGSACIILAYALFRMWLAGAL